jgi:hypothetical protein
MSASKSQPAAPVPDRKTTRRRWGRAQLDNLIDPYKRPAKLHEPTVCPQCRAVFHKGHWQWAPAPQGAEEMLCQACHRINDRYPAGIVTLTGPVVAAHKDEIVRLIRHQEEAEKPEHPLNRLIDIAAEAPDHLVVSTTDIHLPRRIGAAVTRAYHGAVDEHFDEGGYFIRVSWHRDA